VDALGENEVDCKPRRKGGTFFTSGPARKPIHAEILLLLREKPVSGARERVNNPDIRSLCHNAIKDHPQQPGRTNRSMDPGGRGTWPAEGDSFIDPESGGEDHENKEP